MEFLLWCAGFVGSYAGVGAVVTLGAARFMYGGDVTEEMEKDWEKLKSYTRPVSWNHDDAPDGYSWDRDAWAVKINKQRKMSREEWEIEWLREREKYAGSESLKAGYIWPAFLVVHGAVKAVKAISNADKSITQKVGRIATRSALKSREDRLALKEALAYVAEQKRLKQEREAEALAKFDQELEGGK